MKNKNAAIIYSADSDVFELSQLENPGMRFGNDSNIPLSSIVKNESSSISIQHKYHNIVFPDGTKSNPADVPPTADTSQWLAAKDTIDYFIRNREGLSAVDLGCLEGAYAVELAKMGFDTIGIEARKKTGVKQDIRFDAI